MELPTGIGKSVIATTTHKVLRHIKHNWRTAIITATKGLQDQYLRDDKEIFSLKGKMNYGCSKKAKFYGSAECMQLRMSGGCIPAAQCDYFKARNTWCNESPLRLTNTAFQIKAPDTLIANAESRVNLTIIDECHEIDDQLISHAAMNIDMVDLKPLESILGKGFVGKFAAFINEFAEMDVGFYFTVNDEIRGAADKLIGEISDKSEELSLEAKTPGARVGLGPAIDSLRDWAADLSRFAHDGGEWIISEYGFATKLKLTPVYASQVVERGLYSKSDQFIHMSATICGMQEYMKTMAINPGEAALMDAPNPIPLENRPICALNAIKVSGGYDVRGLANLVDAVIARHPNEHGVIHTVSFKLAKEILENSRHKKIMTVSNNREEILSLLGGKKGHIILSPSIETGYDFKGDMARWQIVAKVPFGYLGDPYIKLNTERDGDWYSRKAIVRLVQASGRAVRGVDDYATTYILDSNFQRLYERNRKMFPAWYQDALTML